MTPNDIYDGVSSDELFENEMAGATPLVGDPKVMGQIIHDTLTERKNERIRIDIIALLKWNDGRMFASDILEEVPRDNDEMLDVYKMIFETFQAEGIAKVFLTPDDFGSQRYVVELTQSGMR